MHREISQRSVWSIDMVCVWWSLAFLTTARSACLKKQDPQIGDITLTWATVEDPITRVRFAFGMPRAMPAPSLKQARPGLVFKSNQKCSRRSWGAQWWMHRTQAKHIV